MKYVIFALALLFCSFTLSGQKNISLSGTIVDQESQSPVDVANIRLLSAKDSAFTAGGFSNEQGVFSLKSLSKGEYILHVSYLGYQDIYQPVSLNNRLNVNIGKLLLNRDSYLLEEAVVVGKAAEVVVRNDTVEYNASSFKTTENAVIEDLIKKLPGAEVDKDGKITVNGKEITKFLVDGKEFFSDDPTIASKNLPAEMVKKLQVLDRKSDLARLTGFDDGEEETVINITVNDGMKQGTMGNALAGLGQDMEGSKDLRYQAGAFLNHMKDNDRYTLMLGANNNNNMGAADLGASRFGGMRGMRRGAGGIVDSKTMNFNMNKEFSPKLSLNGNVGFNTMDRNSENKVSETTLSDKQSQKDITSTKTNDISDNFSADFRLEWKPDSNQTFILRPNFSYNKSSSDQTQYSDRLDYYSSDSIISSNTASRNEGKGYNAGISLDYAYQFKKPGRVLSANIRTSYNDSYSQQDYNWISRIFDNGIYSNDSIVNQQEENDQTAKSYRIRATYVEPLGKNYFVQLAYRIAGAETQSVNSTYDLYGPDVNGGEGWGSTNTATVNANKSRSTMYNSIEQRYSISLKSVREKYNYTIGLSLDTTSTRTKTYQPGFNEIYSETISYPVDSRLPNRMGDSLISNISQGALNMAPIINFNYMFNQRTNLRIDYEGETDQPSANQLRDYIDESNPMSLVQGNPSLKPGYRNELRARFNKSVPESQLFYNINLRGNLSFNDITEVTTMLDRGKRLTTYKNINGNWDTQLRGMFSSPLKNKKFTTAGFAMISYNNRKSYVDDMENTMNNFSFMIRPNINYRSDLFDIGINGMFRYSDISYDIRPEDNQKILEWGAGGYTTWYLPYNVTVESDINWTARSGYEKGYNIPETIWNAAVTKRLFSKKAGTGSLKLQIYDILQNRNSISGSSTTNGFRSVESNAIPSFFICSFIYKFSIFPFGSSATESDMNNNGRGQWRGGGGRRAF